MTRRTCDVAIIGGGPAGYSAALRCAEHGLHSIVVESDTIGGTCLNVGCIPSKAVIHAANAFGDVTDRGLENLGITVAGAHVELPRLNTWTAGVVDKLLNGLSRSLSTAGVDIVPGRAEIIDADTLIAHGPDGRRTSISTKHLIIATGSRPTELEALPFDDTTVASHAMFQLDTLPEHLVVVGAGYIGLELGTAMRKLGARVTVIEMADRILPGFDPQLTRPVEHRLRELGVEMLTGSTVVGRTEQGVRLTSSNGGERELEGDLVLVTVGRTPVTDGFGLERLGLTRNGRFLAIDDQCQTSVRGVFSVGDVTGEPMLAHRAIAQAHLVGDVLGGVDRAWDHRCVPAVCFTDPEIFSVGLDPDQVDGSNDVLTARVPFSANGRSLTLDDPVGFVRLVVDTADLRLLGAQAVGPHVAELALVFGVAIEMEATLEDLAATIAAHPTLGESIIDTVHDAIRRAARR